MPSPREITIAVAFAFCCAVFFGAATVVRPAPFINTGWSVK